jgi:hypothetical protein
MRTKALTALAVLLLAAALPGPCWAQGTSGSQFLGIGIGARAQGMGGAFTSVADGAAGFRWNPAGLARATANQVALSHVAWLDDVSYQSAGYVHPLGGAGVLGVTLEGGTLSWDNSGVSTDEPAGEASDFAGSIAYARPLFSGVGVGGAFKYVSSELGPDAASSYAFDLGAVYRLSEDLSLGAAVRNVGSGLAYGDEEDPLPATLAVGGSYAWQGVLVSVDLEKQNDLEAATRVGAEYAPAEFLTLRGGLVSGGESALSAFTGGLGVNWGRAWGLDYAFRDSDLGGTHQLSLSAGFGEAPGLAVAGAGVDREGAEFVRTPKGNLAVLRELVREVMGDAVDRMGIPSDSHVYTKQVESHDASWLVQSVLLEELTDRGHAVMTGAMSAAEEGAEPSASYEIAYRIVSCEITYPRVWREWVIGSRKVERRAAVDVHFQLSDESTAIVWADNVEREKREIVPGGRVDELATPGQSFTAAEIEPGGWDKVLEPVLVAGIVGGLIYLFYTSRSTD